jgi:hypothetical protein
VTVKSSDERLVGRAFSSAAVELALANYPGFFVSSPPGDAQPYGVYWPALVTNDDVQAVVVAADGTRRPVGASPATRAPAPLGIDTAPVSAPSGPVSGEALGSHFAARSGDKGGNANVGIFARDEAGYAWLHRHLTTDVMRRLLPEAADLEVRRHELANLHALNFVLEGYLGEGVASSTAFDSQAKGLGEYLRSRIWP